MIRAVHRIILKFFDKATGDKGKSMRRHPHERPIKNPFSYLEGVWNNVK